MSEKIPKYYIRFSNSQDFKNVLDFYDINVHANVRKRQHELMKQLVEDGAVILIEDEKGKIVASSITYPHKTKDKNGVEHVQWQEIGSTRMVLNGYPGLFDAMIAMQTLRSFLVEPPEDVFVARMHTVPVQNMAKKLGWRGYVAPQELIDIQKKSVSAEDQSTAPPGINWFHCGVEALPVMAKWMEKSMDDGVLVNKKTGEKIELDYSKSTFFKMFGEEIKGLAKKDFGDVEKPDPQQSVRQRRDKWLKNFFR